MANRILPLPIALLLALSAAPRPSSGATEPAARPPNIVLFLADDLGWADTSLTSSFYETPNVERLAREGTRFSAAYATPVCNATRAGLLTGRYPGARLKMVGGRASRTPQVPDSDDPVHPLVRPERMPGLMAPEVTLAEALGAAGYTTWFAGKWDLGRGQAGPESQGFVRVVQVGNRAVRSHIAPFGVPGLPNTPKGTYLADRITDDVVDWIRWEQRGGRPFFLYLAHHSVHVPWQGKPELVEKYRAKAARGDPRAPQRNPVMGAMVQSLDESLGRVLDTLDELGIADQTIVIFLSDNGAVTDTFQGVPITSNAPLRGAKGSLLEGGVRVPLVIRWPGVARAGVTVDAPVSHVDIHPTLLDAAGLSQPSNRQLDGEDLRPLLTGERSKRSAPIFSHYPIHEPSSSVIDGRWKLIRYYGLGPGGTAVDRLYDLQEDVGESRDLAAAQPRKAAELAGLLDAWLEETGALLPVPNPAYRGPSATP
jgi:arylsulfatase A